jgi:thiol-disulfide isomerase/thioredoxin
MRYIVFSIFLALIAALVGATIAIQQHPERFSNLFEKKNEVLRRVPAFAMIDLQGAERTSSEWKDNVMVLNFWAPWCPPCAEETPGFVELQEKYYDKGVRFIGIAIDDPDTVQDFIDTYGVEYPVLLGDMKAINFSRELGNRMGALPYTVVADREGNIQQRYNGGVAKEDLDEVLEKLTRNG